MKSIKAFVAVFCCQLLYASDYFPSTYDTKIVVGLRNDSAPFSYASQSKKDEMILSGYGGYMIEICRRVLHEMITDIDSPFAGYEVEGLEVDASDRFQDLQSGKIDLLCGPNSITLERLANNNVTLPLFLSGISFVSVSDERLPKAPTDCKPVVGMLANTTALTDGLEQIARHDLFLLYDSVIEQFISLPQPPEDQQDLSNVQLEINHFNVDIKNLLEGKYPNEFAKGINAHEEQSTITAQTCKDGYSKSTGPVLVYNTHREGINDLCSGKVLFYVGDVDILRSQLQANKDCENNHVLHHEPFTKEAYAVFFYRPKSMGNRDRLEQALLYSEFNNILLEKMQAVENMLEYVFESEFEDMPASEELRQFFAAYKFIKDQ